MSSSPAPPAIQDKDELRARQIQLMELVKDTEERIEQLEKSYVQDCRTKGLLGSAYTGWVIHPGDTPPFQQGQSSTFCLSKKERTSGGGGR